MKKVLKQIDLLIDVYNELIIDGFVPSACAGIIDDLQDLKHIVEEGDNDTSQ